MDSVDRAGRIIGVLIAIGLIGTGVAKILQTPYWDVGGFLVNAALHSTQIIVSAVLSLAVETLWLVIALTAFPTFHDHVPRMALLLVALATVIVAASSAELATVFSLISISEAYAKGSQIEREQLQAVHVIASSHRNGALIVARLFDAVATFVLYAALLRLALVPRWLAAVGLIAAVLAISTIAGTLFGHRIVVPLLVPIFAVQLILAVWLISKGFTNPRQ